MLITIPCIIPTFYTCMYYNIYFTYPSRKKTKSFHETVSTVTNRTTYHRRVYTTEYNIIVICT